jgi:hypothetical protein
MGVWQELALYLSHRQDESYTPSKISVRVGTHAHDLRETEQLELASPEGWIRVPLLQPDHTCVSRPLVITINPPPHHPGSLLAATDAQAYPYAHGAARDYGESPERAGHACSHALRDGPASVRAKSLLHFRPGRPLTSVHSTHPLPGVPFLTDGCQIKSYVH